MQLPFDHNTTAFDFVHMRRVILRHQESSVNFASPQKEYAIRISSSSRRVLLSFVQSKLNVSILIIEMKPIKEKAENLERMKSLLIDVKMSE